MDFLGFIAAIIGSLAWPLCILILVKILKKPISELILRLITIRYKDLNVIFERAVKGAKKVVPDGKKMESYEVSYFQAIAEVSPRAALLDAWQGFEIEAMSIAHGRGLIGRGQPVQMSKLFHVLQEESLIDKEEEEALIKLRTVRNEVVHAPEVNLSKEQVAEYATLVSQLTNRIQERSDKVVKQTRS